VPDEDKFREIVEGMQPLNPDVEEARIAGRQAGAFYDSLKAAGASDATAEALTMGWMELGCEPEDEDE
jgi:hypothetical protein